MCIELLEFWEMHVNRSPSFGSDRSRGGVASEHWGEVVQVEFFGAVGDGTRLLGPSEAIRPFVEETALEALLVAVVLPGPEVVPPPGEADDEKCRPSSA